MEAEPDSGRTNPQSILMVVVLPAPSGPTSPNISPLFTSNEIITSPALSIKLQDYKIAWLQDYLIL